MKMYCHNKHFKSKKPQSGRPEDSTLLLYESSWETVAPCAHVHGSFFVCVLLIICCSMSQRFLKYWIKGTHPTVSSFNSCFGDRVDRYCEQNGKNCTELPNRICSISAINLLLDCYKLYFSSICWISLSACSTTFLLVVWQHY